MLSVDRLIVGRSKQAWRGTACTHRGNNLNSQLHQPPHLIQMLCRSHLESVVAVVDQEVLLELQRPLASLGLNERHAGRDFLLRLVCVIQEGRGAAEGHFHLLAESTYRESRRQRLWIKTEGHVNPDFCFLFFTFIYLDRH